MTGLRIAAITRPTPVNLVAVAVFVCLNIVDAWLTSILLARGGTEAFWWASHYNSNVFIKGVLALLVAFVLGRMGKARLLKWLNIGMTFVVLSNGLCYLGYLGSLLYWQSRIATFS
jgi:hypothetical protein